MPKSKNYNNLTKELKPLIVQLQELQKQAYLQYLPEVEALIKNKIKDEQTIERLLDRLLDFCGDAQILLLFKKLCRYYWDINPHGTACYINFYRETWDNENNDK